MIRFCTILSFFLMVIPAYAEDKEPVIDIGSLQQQLLKAKNKPMAAPPPSDGTSAVPPPPMPPAKSQTLQNQQQISNIQNNQAVPDMTPLNPELDIIQDKLNTERRKVIDQKRKNNTLKVQIADLEEKISDLEIRLDVQDKRINNLKETARTKITEVMRLRAQCGVSKVKQQNIANKIKTPPIVVRKSKPVKTVTNSVKLTRPRTTVNDIAHEPKIVIAIKDKVNLRESPSTSSKVVSSVKRNTRLTVETVKGMWIRVITPTAGRAWVHRSVVRVQNVS